MSSICNFVREDDRVVSETKSITSSTNNIRKQLSAIKKRLGVDFEIFKGSSMNSVTYRHVILLKNIRKLPNFLKLQYVAAEDIFSLYVVSEFPFFHACEEVEEARGDDGIVLSPPNPECEGVIKYARKS